MSYQLPRSGPPAPACVPGAQLDGTRVLGSGGGHAGFSYCLRLAACCCLTCAWCLEAQASEALSPEGIPSTCGGTVPGLVGWGT